MKEKRDVGGGNMTIDEYNKFKEEAKEFLSKRENIKKIEEARKILL